MTAPTLPPTERDIPFEHVPPVQRVVPRLRPPRTSPPRAMAAAALVAALVASIAAVAIEGPGSLDWSLVSGQILVDDVPLGIGDIAPVDTTLVGGEGGGVLETAAGRITVAADAEITVTSPQISLATTVTLADGQLLVDAPTAPISVDATVATITGVGGVFRIERDDSPRIASYSASVAVDGDRDVPLRRLTQVDLDSDPGSVDPIILDPADPWDIVHGALPLATDLQLGQLSAGLRASYGTAPQQPAFYQDFVGVTEGLVEVLPRLAPIEDGALFGPPAETLVAAASVTALVEGTALPLDQIINTVINARAGGGTWGVILAQNDLDAAFLRDVADGALRRRAALGQEATPVISPPAADRGVSQPPVAQPTTPTTPTPTPTPTPSPQPTQPPTPPRNPDPPSPSPSPSPGPLEDPVGTLDDLIGGGSDDGTSPPPAPGQVVDDLVTNPVGAVSEPVGTIDGLVGGVVGGTGGVVGGVLDLLGVAGWFRL